MMDVTEISQKMISNKKIAQEIKYCSKESIERYNGHLEKVVDGLESLLENVSNSEDPTRNIKNSTDFIFNANRSLRASGLTFLWALSSGNELVRATLDRHCFIIRFYYEQNLIKKESGSDSPISYPDAQLDWLMLYSFGRDEDALWLAKELIRCFQISGIKDDSDEVYYLEEISLETLKAADFQSVESSFVPGQGYSRNAWKNSPISWLVLSMMHSVVSQPIPNLEGHVDAGPYKTVFASGTLCADTVKEMCDYRASRTVGLSTDVSEEEDYVLEFSKLSTIAIPLEILAICKFLRVDLQQFKEVSPYLNSEVLKRLIEGSVGEPCELVANLQKKFFG